MGKYNLGEVWWTQFPFEEIEESKRRPAIVIDEISTNEQENEKLLFEELDKGIDDMETGRVVTHEEAMQIIRKRVEKFP
jgi:predicted transcriptional regulator